MSSACEQEFGGELRWQLCHAFAERTARVMAGMSGDCDAGLLGDDPASAGDALVRVRGGAAELAAHAEAIAHVLSPAGPPKAHPLRALVLHASTLLLDLDGVVSPLLVDVPDTLVVRVDGGEIVRGLLCAAIPVATSGGQVRVTASARGAVVEVCLDGPDGRIRAERLPAAGEDGRGGDRSAPRARRALVAEDNLSLRELETIALEAMFDEVLCASDGEEALAILSRFGGEVDLLVLDLRMPKRNGIEVLGEAIQRWPGLKVVVASGAAPDGTAQSASLAGARAVLAKPFRLGELRAVVRSVLDGATW